MQSWVCGRWVRTGTLSALRKETGGPFLTGSQFGVSSMTQGRVRPGGGKRPYSSGATPLPACLAPQASALAPQAGLVARGSGGQGGQPAAPSPRLPEASPVSRGVALEGACPVAGHTWCQRVHTPPRGRASLWAGLWVRLPRARHCQALLGALWSTGH